VNPPIQTGLTSTSSDRRLAPNANFVRGKSGYAPFWPGGLDAIVETSNDGSTKVGTKGLRTVPPGLKRGILLPVEKSSDPTPSELYDPDGNKVEDGNLVIPSAVGLAMGSQTYNSPRRYPTSWKSSFCQTLCRASLRTSIIYYQLR
jgi:Ski2 N-terminal region